MSGMLMRSRLPLAAAPLLACRGTVEVVATPAMPVAALPGETHLRNVQQLTHGGNNLVRAVELDVMLGRVRDDEPAPFILSQRGGPQ